MNCPKCGKTGIDSMDFGAMKIAICQGCDSVFKSVDGDLVEMRESKSTEKKETESKKEREEEKKEEKEEKPAKKKAAKKKTSKKSE